MNYPDAPKSRLTSYRLPSRRAFLKGLAIAPACLALPRWAFGANASAGPASHGPVGRTIDASGEIKEYKDAETGARVRMLTGDGSDNVHLYFTSESFVSGSDAIVFGSNRTGKFQHYLLDIKSKRLTQLTDGEDISPTRACLGGGGQLLYFDGPELRALKVDTLEDRVLYRVPDGFEASLPTCTARGDFVAFAYKEKAAKSTGTNVIYSNMAETFYQHPGSVVMRIDTSNGTPVAVWGERNWISHVLIHPTDPSQILFCHEGGGLVGQRMFMADVHDITRKAGVTPLFAMRDNEFTVHEYFTRGGEIGFQYEVQREGKMEYYDAFSRTDGTWVREYRLPGPRPGHIQSNTNNTLVVGDRGYLSEDDKTGDNYMSLMTHENGSERVRRLCRREPGDTQFSHGHPVFSLDDQWVLYNSRIGPKENIAMADVTSI